MSFKDFYTLRMEALHCGHVDGSSAFSAYPFPITSPLPLSVASPYYKDRDIWRHYPNMYDFRQASMFNIPPPVMYPFNHPMRQPGYLVGGMDAQDFRKSSPISKRQH